MSSTLPMSTPTAAMRAAISSFFSSFSSSRLLDVQHLAPQRQHGLVDAVAAALGASRRPSPLPPGTVRSSRGSRVVQSISLPGSPPPPSSFLRSMMASRAFFAAMRASAASAIFLQIRVAVLRVLLQVLGQRLVHHAGDDAPRLRGCSSFTFVCDSKQRVRVADADDGGEALAEVFALQFEAVLEVVFLLAVGGERPREAGAEAGQVRAAVRVVGVVGEAASRSSSSPLLYWKRDFDR